MAQDLISKKTRKEFQEWLVGWILRDIDSLFDNHGIGFVSLPPEQLPSGERRSRVEGYYASIDWTNSTDTRKILSVYEDILFEMREPTVQEKKQYFIDILTRDGYAYENGHIVSVQLKTDLLAAISSDAIDLSHLNIYVDRIRSSVETDPALAIGSIKELMEATFKTILMERLVPFDKKDDVSKLLKAVQQSLDLVPNDIDESRKGSDIIRKVLSNLGQVAIGIAELRNLYGTGHGRSSKHGLQPRHARLVVSAGAALCAFLLEIHELREQQTSSAA